MHPMPDDPEAAPSHARQRDIRDDRARDRQETLIARLRARGRDARRGAVRAARAARGAEHELEDLRAIRDALTPPELPQRPGLELAASFLPAAEQVSGDFYLVAEGPRDSTLLVIGDVVGHGMRAARRAAFVRTAFAATAPFSDDPCRLLSWANTALVERAGTSTEFVTAALRDLPPGGESSCAGPTPAIRRPCGSTTAASSSRPSRDRRSGSTRTPEYVEGSRRCEGPRACCSTPTG